MPFVGKYDHGLPYRGTSRFTHQSRPSAHAAQWVEPRLVGEVAFTEWTSDMTMRHPSWRGLRPDKYAARYTW